MLTKKDKKSAETEKNLLTIELSEIKEISDIIFRRIEKKIAVLSIVEASLDKKIASIERLINRAEYLKAPLGGINRQHEVIALKHRGLKAGEIAEILDMPVGEIEVILEFHLQKT